MRELKDFKNIHENEDIYVLASGKSVDFIDNSFFENKIIIGINQVYKKIPCQYLVRKDAEGMEEIIKKNKDTIHFISKGSCGDLRPERITKTANKLKKVDTQNVVLYNHNNNECERKKCELKKPEPNDDNAVETNSLDIKGCYWKTQSNSTIYWSNSSTDIKPDVQFKSGDHFFNHRSENGFPKNWKNIRTIFKIILPTEENSLYVSFSTITTGIHLAAHMGAKNIILVGHDCGTLNGECNFTGYHTKQTMGLNWRGNEKGYEKWLLDIEGVTIELKKTLQEKYGCNICSLNPFINFNLEGNIYEK
tara:strand:+ start:323 stop:1240 length:918 start_codon:yes stop_codon:yes gene_type:complete